MPPSGGTYPERFDTGSTCKDGGTMLCCLTLLERVHAAAGTGRWEDMIVSSRDYISAFDRMKTDMEATGSVREEALPVIRKLEREQRCLVRAVQQRKQVLRDQIGILDDASNHLQRVKSFSRSIQQLPYIVT